MTADQIKQLGANECNVLCDHLDQQLVAVLQQIDANMLRATTAITEKILPAVEGYGQASAEIWQSVKVRCVLSEQMQEFSAQFDDYTTVLEDLL